MCSYYIFCITILVLILCKEFEEKTQYTLFRTENDEISDIIDKRTIGSGSGGLIHVIFNEKVQYHRSMNQVLKKFYGKHKDMLIYYYTDLKGEPQEYEQLLTQFVDEKRTELKVLVEWIVKEIEQEAAEEAVHLFCKNLYDLI